MELKVFNLGLLDFGEGLRFQQNVFESVAGGRLDNALIVCRHYPVITMGRGAKQENITVSRTELERMGIGVYETGRGGDVTYHGPGQLTVYPIFNLGRIRKDIRFYLRGLEEAAIALLCAFGVNGARREGLTGVWIEGRKVASIGVAVRRWVTFHGISINVKNEDLDNFRLIRPCGMDIEMTSMETASGRGIEFSDIEPMVEGYFRERFITSS